MIAVSENVIINSSRSKSLRVIASFVFVCKPHSLKHGEAVQGYMQDW